MRPRIIIALLVIMAFSLTAISRPLSLISKTAIEEEEMTISPAEEHEAREIAAAFNEQLEKGNDIAPLIDKYFVGDFAERFAREAAENFWFPAKPKALLQATPADVRRYYIALTNFQFLFIRMMYTLEKQQKERADEESEHTRVEKLFPPEVIYALRSHPRLATLTAEDEPQNASQENPLSAEKENAVAGEAAQPVPDDEEEDVLKTPEQLNELATAMENASHRIRKYLDSLPVEQTSLIAIIPKEDVPEQFANSSFAVLPNAYLVDEDFFGLDKGTRLICAHVFNLHIDMLNIEGKLKVLAVYMQLSD